MIKYNLWAAIQSPFFQAKHIINDNIVASIPNNIPGTPTKKIWAVGRYDNDLIVVKNSHIELYDISGQVQNTHIYNENIYGCHGVYKYGENIILVSAYLDKFIILDLSGNLLWEWRAYDHGLSDINIDTKTESWKIIQTTKTESLPQFINDKHFNTIRLIKNESSFITSSLRTGEIYQIDINSNRYNMIHKSIYKGIHAPIIIEGNLLYGTSDGLCINGNIYYDKYKWIKHIDLFDNYIIFSHDSGIVFLNHRYEIVHEVFIAKPWLFFLH